VGKGYKRILRRGGAREADDDDGKNHDTRPKTVGDTIS
jgi:hypothetical protein